MQRDLLLNLVHTYARLNQQEQQEMQAILDKPEYKDVREEELTYASRLERIGEKRGRQDGRQEGAAVARQAIADLCEVLGIGLSAAQTESLARMSLPELDTLRQHIKTQRR